MNSEYSAAPDLFAPVPAGFVGIARLAQQSAHLDDGHEVEYFELPSRSLLNRCTSKRMPFTWTINPYRGCEFACKYCYARYTHEFMEMRDGLDFERKIYAKQNASWLLRQDLKRVRAGEEIAIGTATDPYQPAERKFGITRSILEELSRHAGLELGIVTKSTLILRDLDLLKRIAEKNQVAINLTVTTTNAKLARILEPRAPRPDLRLQVVRKLAGDGLQVGVICAPVLPGITDASGDLENLVAAAAQAGAQWFYSNPLFLKPCSEKIFMPFLEKEFPELAESYRQRYASQAFVSAAYRKRISEIVHRLCGKHGIGRRFGRSPKSTGDVPTETQLALF